MRLRFAFALLALLPLAATGAEEPEVVYAKFHRAAVSGNVNEMGRYANAAQRADLAGMSAAQKDAQGKMMAALLPRAFLLQSKILTPDGKGARLLVSGPGEALLGDKPEMLYGSIQMLLEGDEWKVGEMDWSNTKPALPAQARPAPAKPAAVPKAQSARGAPVVGSSSAAPERKLGTAKSPCVYKPVMTDEDIENCR